MTADDLHQQHARSFDRAAQEYEKGRPPYPDAAVSWSIPTGATRVLDLGAGTGKLTRELTRRVTEVVAVEPSPEMRGVLRDVVPDAVAREGSAESIPLEDASVDAVVVAQAWHWVDPTRAVPEVARVLRPGGTLTLLWNTRDEAEPWVAELGTMIGGVDRMDDLDPLDARFFAPWEVTTVRWEHGLSRNELINMVASRSYVITMPTPERTALLARVRELPDTHPDLRDRQEITMPYVTHCFRATRN